MRRWSRRGLPGFECGFTLLEVLLALFLSVVLLAAVTMAIRIHLELVDSGRSDVEQAQLARTVLRRMADDVRATILYQPMDFSSMTSSLLGGATGGSGGQGSTGGGGTGGGASDGSGSSGQGSSSGGSASGAGGSTSSSGTGSSSTSSSSASSVAPPTVPGLFGSATDIEIDVSRIPRLDEFANTSGSEAVAGGQSMATDVKTVAYYIVSETAGVGSQGYGLYRREVDRAVTRYADSMGNTDALNAQGVLLAPEVIAVEYRYFDGTEWSSEWDSDERQGLPMAVEIAIALVTDDDPIASALPSSLFDVAGIRQPGYAVYRLLVYVPAGMPSSEDSTGSSASTSGSSSTGSSGGSQTGAGT